MYKILFIIIYAATLVMGITKMENIVASKVPPPPSDNIISKIDLGHMLRLVRAGNIAIIDARQLSDYEKSHIPNALSVHGLDTVIGNSRLDERIEKARNIIVYSNRGLDEQIRQYIDFLVMNGKEGVFYYAGGFGEWLATGLPIETNN
jgi:rhodanese-related sulfurtransferase